MSLFIIRDNCCVVRVSLDVKYFVSFPPLHSTCGKLVTLILNSHWLRMNTV